MWKYGETTIRVGRSWVNADGVTHPRNWSNWSDEEKAAAGLTYEPDPAPFDSRFYWSADVEKALDDVNAVDDNGDPLLDEDGVQVVTKGLKTNAIALVKTQAGGLLAPTDWMVIKASEVGDYSVPTSVLEFRAAVRLASNQIEAAILSTSTLDEFKSLYDAPVDADGNPTGNAPINDWPEADS